MGGKNAIQMRADLRTDLKDSGSLWSNGELDRAIEKSIADFSRMLPLEKVYEESLQFTVTDESVTMPADTDAVRIVIATNISTSTAGDLLSIAAQPDVPRPVTATIVDANNSITGLTLIIKGMDENEKGITEILHYSTGDSKTLTGKKYFKQVREVEIDQIVANGTGDTLSVGIGAYTDVWVALANKPVKWASETSVTDVDSNAIVRNTDFYIDYREGRIKAISGGDIVAADTVTISYTRFQLGIDLSALPDFIRVERVEYPVGEIPQNFPPWDIWGNVVYVTGGGEAEEQQSMQEDRHIAVYYAAEHRPPTEYSPSTVPEFLENTILLAASAYALFQYALKQEHQAETDASSMRTALGSANGTHSALALILDDIKKYLDNNSDADAAGILQDITDGSATLREAINIALTAANVYLDEVDTTDLQGAEGVWADYGSTYVTGSTDPAIKSYLVAGDALLNTLAVGGEGVEVPRAYREYAEAVGAIVRAHENKRTDFLQGATARTNAAIGYVQEAVQRLSNLRSHIEQANGYSGISNTFARHAEALLTRINSYLGQASGYAEAAGAQMVLADRYRNEAIQRRSEAWSVWMDRKQYIGDFVSSTVRQMPRYSND